MSDFEIPHINEKELDTVLDNLDNYLRKKMPSKKHSVMPKSLSIPVETKKNSSSFSSIKTQFSQVSHTSDHYIKIKRFQTLKKLAVITLFWLIVTLIIFIWLYLS